MDLDEPSAGWQNGDPAAFGRLVERWQARVARFLARLTGDQDAVADLCQEVFLRVYLARSRYRDQHAFSTWLFQIALNVGRDALRQQRRFVLPGLDSEPPDDAMGPEGVYEERELVQIVGAALAQLSEPLREVLVLRHYEEMSFEEISRVLHVPASTLKSRFAVALQRLRLELERRGYSHEEIH